EDRILLTRSRVQPLLGLIAILPLISLRSLDLHEEISHPDFVHIHAKRTHLIAKLTLERAVDTNQRNLQLEDDELSYDRHGIELLLTLRVLLSITLEHGLIKLSFKGLTLLIITQLGTIENAFEF